MMERDVSELEQYVIKEKSTRQMFRLPIEHGDLHAATIYFHKPFYNDPVEVEISDISPNGMRIRSSESIPLNRDISIEFSLPAMKCPVQTRALGLYCLKKGGYYEVGLSFFHLDGFVKGVITCMMIDYVCCDNRIETQVQNVCQNSCRFYSLCHKTQKTLF